MLSASTYIEKANGFRDIVNQNKFGVPYYHGDITFKCIRAAIDDVVYFGCKAILSNARMSVSYEKEEMVEYIRTNHEVGYLIDKIKNSKAEWEFHKLNRNDSFADQWLHDCSLWLRDFCVYLETHLR